MSNMIVHCTFSLNIPERKVADLVRQPDDDSDSWFQMAATNVEDYVRNNVMDAVQAYSQGEPSVEVVA